MSRNHQPDRQSSTEKEAILLNCYLDVLLIMGRQAAEICPSVGAGAQETTHRLRRRLAFESRPQDLDEAHDILHGTMRDFGRRAKEQSDERALEFVNLYSLASRTSALQAARDRSYLEQLRDVTRKLQDAAMCLDPEETRRRCEQTAITLTRITELFQDDSSMSQVQLRQELAGFEERRKVAEEASALDPLTGLFNREEVERRMRDALALGKQFCILKLGVHEFSGLSDRYGDQINDLLRKSAADKLSAQVRPRDILAQWDPNTFLLLFFDCSLAVAESRADQISMWLSGDYRLYLDDQIVHADVQLTAAATEVQPGEHPDKFVARAEALSPVVLTAVR